MPHIESGDCPIVYAGTSEGIWNGRRTIDKKWTPLIDSTTEKRTVQPRIYPKCKADRVDRGAANIDIGDLTVDAVELQGAAIIASNCFNNRQLIQYPIRVTEIGCVER